MKTHLDAENLQLVMNLKPTRFELAALDVPVPVHGIEEARIIRGRLTLILIFLVPNRILAAVQGVTLWLGIRPGVTSVARSRIVRVGIRIPFERICRNIKKIRNFDQTITQPLFSSGSSNSVVNGLLILYTLNRICETSFFHIHTRTDRVTSERNVSDQFRSIVLHQMRLVFVAGMASGKTDRQTGRQTVCYCEPT